MIPILFPYDAVDFSSHGIGDLMDTISCTTELNEDGEYELELEYPADGKYIHELMIDNLIYAKADDHGPYQAFRIYSIEKAINSLVTVHAQHISYDLSCYPVKAYEAKTCHTAITHLIPYAISQSPIPFSITTDVTAEAQNEDRKFKLEEPKSVRAALLDGDDSIKGTFGGDLIFDNFDVSLKKVGGADRGVLVEYGIDLIDMDQEENISEMITGVYPYWKGRDLTRDEDGNYIEHTDKDGESVDKIIYGSVQYAAGTFKRHRVIPLNVTEYCVNLFDAEGNDREPTVSEINQIARDWIEANEIGEPEISLTVSYADLKKDVRMHDAITVRFVKLGIDVKAKVVSYKYDTLKERCIQVTVGKAKPSILFDLEDASRLKRGLIPPKRIQNRSITSEKIETRAITPDVIDNNAIQAQHIEPEAVQSLQLDAAVQEQLGYAELFHAATLDPADIDIEALPEQFSSKELRVVDADGNLLTEMSSDGLSSFNFNILDGSGNSTISMQNSGSIHAKNIYASVIVESPTYSLPVGEGADEQTVNKHTHVLTPNDDGEVHIGPPDFTGADHFFNIADTKFFNDRMSAVQLDSFLPASYTTSADFPLTVVDSNLVRIINGKLCARFQIKYKNGSHDYGYVSLPTESLFKIDSVTQGSIISESQADKSLKIDDSAYTRYDKTNDRIYGTALVKLTNGVEQKVYVALNASGKESGTSLSGFVPSTYRASTESDFRLTYSANDSMKMVNANLCGVFHIQYKDNTHDYGYVSMNTTNLFKIDSVTKGSIISESQADKSLKIDDSAYTRYDSANDRIYGTALVKLTNGVEQKVYVALNASRKTGMALNAFVPSTYRAATESDFRLTYSANDSMKMVNANLCGVFQIQYKDNTHDYGYVSMNTTNLFKIDSVTQGSIISESQADKSLKIDDSAYTRYDKTNDRIYGTALVKLTNGVEQKVYVALNASRKVGKSLGSFAPLTYRAATESDFRLTYSANGSMKMVNANLCGVFQIKYSDTTHDYGYVSMNTTNLFKIDSVTQGSIISESQADKSLKIDDTAYTRYDSANDRIYGTALVKLTNGVEQKVYVALNASKKTNAAPAYNIPEDTRSISISKYPNVYYGTADYNSAKMLAHFYVDGNERSYSYDVNVSSIRSSTHKPQIKVSATGYKYWISSTVAFVEYTIWAECNGKKGSKYTAYYREIFEE